MKAVKDTNKILNNNMPHLLDLEHTWRDTHGGTHIGEHTRRDAKRNSRRDIEGLEGR